MLKVLFSFICIFGQTEVFSQSLNSSDFELQQLREQIINQNKILGVKTFTLEVRVSNYSAINLYENIGFIKDAIRPNYYSGNPKEDALLMSLGL